jgi:hypothetical protein
MSRVAKNPVKLPKGVTVTVASGEVTVKGGKGSLTLALAKGISVVQEQETLAVRVDGGSSGKALVPAAGATRAHRPVPRPPGARTAIADPPRRQCEAHKGDWSARLPTCRE